jgi:hypothetical protein
MSWASLANNQTISFNNLQDAVTTGVLSPKIAIPVSTEQITKDDANTYVWINTAFGPYASKASNQLVVKSNMACAVPFASTTNIEWWGIANNETTSSPIQLLAGFNNGGDGRIFRSTDYGVNYSSVLIISQALYSVKFMPAFRHASYLTVPPFVSVGQGGRIVTNSVTDCSSWVTISSPTTQNLYAVAYNNIGTGIIVGDSRILRTSTTYRINAWSIVNSNANVWNSVASDGSVFVAVGNNSSIITGTSLGSVWTARSMPPLAPSNITLNGVAYHTDGYFYAVGVTGAGAGYMMRSNDGGITWAQYTPSGDPFLGNPRCIESINNRLVIGANNYQWQIRNDVLTVCGANSPSITITWRAVVKNANSNGFDMAGSSTPNGYYSNF